MLRLRHYLTIIFLLFSTPVFSVPSSFEAAEHVTLGDNIALGFSKNTPKEAGRPLSLANGLLLTYGDLISFGDLYGIAEHPVSSGKSVKERAKFFMQAFDSFARSETSLNESKKILNIIHEEKTFIESELKKGEKPQDIYKKLGSSIPRQLNCVTGGGCDEKTWWLKKGRYLTLAEENYDHFGNDAWIAYDTGHTLAILQAQKAHVSQNRADLELAYALNAFASHFLSDRFAAGHIRVPRHRLPENTSPAIIGTLLAGIMHTEENNYGLHVYNQQGEHWVAYGDKTYFNKESAEHRLKINNMLQRSADDIFETFLYGTLTDTQHKEMLPLPEETANKTKRDISALFYWDKKSKSLLRRETLKDPFDRHWTKNWWGWSTLIELGYDMDLPAQDQRALVRAGLGQKAMQAGLIKDPDVLCYLRATCK